MRDLELDRARFAFDSVQALTLEPRKAKDYRNELHSAATLVQTLGLAQTLAFYAGGEVDRAVVREQVLGWLGQSELTKQLFVGVGVGPAAVYSALLRLESTEYAVAADEALALLVWLKRFADGRWDKTGCERAQ